MLHTCTYKKLSRFFLATFENMQPKYKLGLLQIAVILYILLANLKIRKPLLSQFILPLRSSRSSELDNDLMLSLFEELKHHLKDSVDNLTRHLERRWQASHLSGTHRKLLPQINEDVHHRLSNLINLISSCVDAYKSLVLRNDLLKKSSLKHIKKYELTRRKLRRDSSELHWFITFKPRAFSNDSKLHNWIEFSQKVFLTKALCLMEKIRQNDGLSHWRQKTAEKISRTIQQRLDNLQHPQNCDQAKFLTCNFIKGGFGAAIHHPTMCLIIAYHTNRTLILTSKGLNYKDYFNLFKPVSSCTLMQFKNVTQYNEANRDTKVVSISTYIGNFQPEEKLKVLTLPREFSDEIIAFSGDPAAWWIGQFLKYLLRPNEELKQIQDEIEAKTLVGNPLVGLHIRRTDKIRETGEFKPVSEYMKQASNAFDFLLQLSEEPNKERNVLVISDDKTVFSEIEIAYPNYTLRYDQLTSSVASQRLRYSYNGTLGILKDIHSLRHADFVVCTFSSNVCRMVYELFHTQCTNAEERFFSLDVIWHMYSINYRPQFKAIMDHNAIYPEEFNFKKGQDIFTFHCKRHNDHNWFRSRGTASRKPLVWPNAAKRYFPLYKTEQVIPVEDDPFFNF